MFEIPLTRGMIAQVSNQDADQNEFNWSICGIFPWHYATRQITISGVRKTVFLHKVIAARMGLVGGIDHEDKNRFNNQRPNLREATQQQNLWNASMKSSNTTGYRGVHYNIAKRKYEASIRIIKGEKSHLGYFNTAIEAALAYDCAAKRFHKEFASLNFPE